jgi:prophage regulatory protein
MVNLLILPRILDLTTQSKSTLYRNIRLGEFPPPVKVSRNRVAWRQDDVESWLASRQMGGAHHG